MVKILMGLTLALLACGMAVSQGQPAAAPASATVVAPATSEVPADSETGPFVPLPSKLTGNLKECPQDMEYIIVDYNPKRIYEICIDRYEYPNQKGLFPRTGITWYQAKQLCNKQGKYLCSDRQWLEACQGMNNWDFGYYNVFDAEKCNVQSEAAHKSGDHPECKTRNYEVFDLIGNVREWTAGGGVGASGGTFKNGRGARCSRWDPLSLKQGYDDVGFRCCVKVNTGRYGKVSMDMLKNKGDVAPAADSLGTDLPETPPTQGAPVSK
ncbi:MAG: SUMF1/EgtB/PvdO family nonheme iron enzyme [Fibrobacterota bacterium]